MSRVHVLATSETSAGRASADADDAYRSESVDIEDLITAAPGLHALATLTTEYVCHGESLEMDDAFHLELAARVNALFANDVADGVVIVHATDTIEETAYFLHLTVKSSRPVVLTEALPSTSPLGADGPLNLYNAIAVAADPRASGHGVIVVVNDELHSARDVTKSSTSDLQTLVSPGPGLLGTARCGSRHFYRRPTQRHTAVSEFSTMAIGTLARVDILYAHSSMPADLVRASVDHGARGIVIAKTGNDSVPGDAAGALARVAKAGVTIVRSSRAVSNELERNVYTRDDALDSIFAGQLNPPKSPVLR